MYHLDSQKFGLLTATKYIGNSQWLCNCDCGNEKIVSTYHLTHGVVRSCGCLIGKQNKKYNKFEQCYDYYIGYDNKNAIFLFDQCDYDKIKDICWNIDSHGYVKSIVNNKKVYLHRYIFDYIPADKYVDHIKTENKFDCRRANLRIVSYSQNNENAILKSNNTSGVTGVDWVKRKQRWRARINVDKKTILLGYFKNFDDAVKTRKEAEEKYFGEYSYDNSQVLYLKNLQETS